MTTTAAMQETLISEIKLTPLAKTIFIGGANISDYARKLRGRKWLHVDLPSMNARGGTLGFFCGSRWRELPPRACDGGVCRNRFLR